MKRVNISEIFGPTIQGEGRFLGVPTIFVRTAGCDYRCDWCDTMFAVDPIANHKQWKMWTAEEIRAEIDRIASPFTSPISVTFSGGNPAIQPLREVVRGLDFSGHACILETQGSILPTWADDMTAISLSPKPPSSKMETDLGQLDAWLDLIQGNNRLRETSQVKMVVADEVDFEWAKEIAGRCYDLPIYLQPCNLTPQGDGLLRPLLAKYEWLTGLVLSSGWGNAIVTPQMHALLWGNERGR